MYSVIRRSIPVAVLMCVVTLLVASAAMARQGADLTVTVSYTGKGPVNEQNDVLVFLFDHPDPTSQSRPLGVQTVTKNGGVATFKPFYPIVNERARRRPGRRAKPNLIPNHINSVK